MRPPRDILLQTGDDGPTQQQLRQVADSIDAPPDVLITIPHAGCRIPGCPITAPFADLGITWLHGSGGLLFKGAWNTDYAVCDTLLERANQAVSTMLDERRAHELAR